MLGATSWFMDGTFSLGHHVAGRARGLPGAPLVRVPIPLWGLHPRELITSQYHHTEGTTSAYKFGGRQTFGA